MKFVRIIIVLFCAALTTSYSQNIWQGTSLGAAVGAVGLVASGKDTNSLVHGPGAMLAGTSQGNAFVYAGRPGEWNQLLFVFPAIRSMASDTVNGVSYVGTTTGIYRSINGGRTWAFCGFWGYEVYDLEVNQRTGRVYAVLYKETTMLDNNIGIQYSTNKGVSWSKLYTAVICRDVFVMEDNSLLAACSDGVRVFTPGSGSGLGNPGSVLYSVAGTSTGKIFTGTRDGLFKKEATGGFVNVLPASSIGAWVYSIYASSTGIIYAGTSGSAVYRSVDGGVSWQPYRSGMSQYESITKLNVSSAGKLFASGGKVYETLDPVEPPTTVRLLSPPDDSVDIVNDLTLDWDTAYTTGLYSLQIARDSMFLDMILNDSLITESTYRIRAEQLQSNTTYFWRVSAANIAGKGKWSVKRRFSTGILVGIDEDDANEEFSGGFGVTVFPNPVREKINFLVYSGSDGVISVEIFNTLGEQVFSSSELTVAKGSCMNSLEHGLISGIYFMRVTSHPYAGKPAVLTKKIIILN